MTSSNVTEFVDAVLECTAPITQALDHMLRAPGDPGIDAVLATLRTLLCDVLSPLATHDDLRAATAVLEATTPLIIENLFMVPHPRANGRPV